MIRHKAGTIGVTLVAAAGVVVAASCTDRAEPTRPNTDAAHVHVAAKRSGAPVADLGPRLAELRRAVAKFHDFEAAQRAGYTARITPCMEDAPGGMGFHYARPDLINGVAIEGRPEVLLYEPQANGRLRFVGVEFIIPFAEWTSAQPPVLYGQTMARNLTFEVWALHVWVGRENPRGIFSDWNPKVSCDNA
jgi:hypothetical protein